MKNIAYLTTSFGKISHTFIRREVLELRKLGVPICLFGTRRQQEAITASHEAGALDDETSFLYPLRWKSLLLAHGWLFVRSPFHYVGVFASALFNEELSARKHCKLFYHFLCAGYLAREMSRKGVEHIHAHFMNVPATLAMYAARLMGITFSITLHSGGVAGLPEFDGVKAKYLRAAFLCCISDFTRDYYVKLFKGRPNVFKVRCGLDLSRYEYRPASAFPRGPRVKLFAVGRFEDKKGFVYLIEALRLLVKAGLDFELALIGEGSQAEELERRVEEYELTDRVSFLGPGTEEKVLAELGSSDICVVPSVVARSGEMEGLPVVIMEAMAVGVSVVASRHAGIPELVRDGETGVLTEEKMPGSIAAGILRMVREDDLRTRCRVNARRMIEEEYDIRKIASQKADIFRTCA